MCFLAGKTSVNFKITTSTTNFPNALYLWWHSACAIGPAARLVSISWKFFLADLLFRLPMKTFVDTVGNGPYRSALLFRLSLNVSTKQCQLGLQSSLVLSQRVSNTHEELGKRSPKTCRCILPVSPYTRGIFCSFLYCAVRPFILFKNRRFKNNHRDISYYCSSQLYHFQPNSRWCDNPFNTVG